MTCIAIIDVETTGLNPYRHDRIVELAAVVVRPDGTVLRTFETLVNPERDMGPTHLHGLSTSDVLTAPRFGEIAGALLEALEGCTAMAGHNIQFDHSFLAVEFDRLGYPLPDGPTLCTMRLAGGGSLASACSDYGIAFEGVAHTALHDARATAQLLTALLSDAAQLRSNISRLQPISWPNIPKSSARLLTREVSRLRQTEPPTYLQRPLLRARPDMPCDDKDSARLAYTALLDRLLEDRCIDEQEGQNLIELAARWAISGDQIREIHTDYLMRLIGKSDRSHTNRFWINTTGCGATRSKYSLWYLRRSRLYEV
jgi:DNA polymerase-3 subunit epsilon